MSDPPLEGFDQPGSTQWSVIYVADGLPLDSISSERHALCIPGCTSPQPQLKGRPPMSQHSHIIRKPRVGHIVGHWIHLAQERLAQAVDVGKVCMWWCGVAPQWTATATAALGLPVLGRVCQCLGCCSLRYLRPHLYMCWHQMSPSK